MTITPPPTSPPLRAPPPSPPTAKERLGGKECQATSHQLLPTCTPLLCQIQQFFINKKENGRGYDVSEVKPVSSTPTPEANAKRSQVPISPKLTHLNVFPLCLLVQPMAASRVVTIERYHFTGKV
ncbi:hypothetical protein E2C01_063146 [Portunus trituberculatus]|uniref:Uncharacterized protein n=1 Tax=Portunus trituberculatus TaxID=210409 RepID=A0A5B7HHB7_PORTR|nr:hypothetical protein [Portunus trituberculatus]